MVLFIGVAGSAFNSSKEMELGFGDSIELNGYKLVCQSYSQDSTPNYDTDYALLDVFHKGKKITQLAPERRFYNASQQTSTIVAIHSTLARDLYVVFEGQEPRDRPAHRENLPQPPGELDLDRCGHRDRRLVYRSCPVGPAFCPTGRGSRTRAPGANGELLAHSRDSPT